VRYEKSVSSANRIRGRSEFRTQHGSVSGREKVWRPQSRVSSRKP
jgi:hypothetical protein